MAKEIDDIFKDFEFKVKGKEPKKEERKFEEYKEEKPKEKEWVEKPKSVSSKPASSPSAIERATYIVIILVLLGYTIYNISFSNGKEKAKESSIEKQGIVVLSNSNESKQINATSNATIAKNETKEKESKTEPEKKKDITLTGMIELTIDKVHTEDVNLNQSTGKITQVDFIIDNGKVDPLYPVVDVYIYDSNLDESWQTRSRGHYEYSIGIAPGKKHSASVDITPKTFKDLNLKKNVRVSLNDTSGNFITSENIQFSIQ